MKAGELVVSKTVPQNMPKDILHIKGKSYQWKPGSTKRNKESFLLCFLL